MALGTAQPGTAALAKRRRLRLAEAMAKAGIDLVVVYGNAWQNDYFRYVTDYGILEGEGIAIMDRDGAVRLYLDHPLEAERAEVETPELTTLYAPEMLKDVEQLLERSGNVSIGAGPQRLFPRRFAKAVKDLRIADATAMIDKLLMVKLDDEIAAIKAAASMADEGYDVFVKAARVGAKDYELIAAVENFYRAKRVDDNFMIIGVGGVEVRGMAPPAGKVVEKGDLVTTELTPCINGYYVQICRTLVVGEPNVEQLAAFNVYHEAMVAGINAVKPGVTASDIARAENEIFRREGLGDYVTNKYTRVRGHGLGLFVDTKPHILEDVQTVIEEGMTMIVHPNTYHPKVGYMVLGDSIIVNATGCDVLTTTPRELIRVPA
jgi:Xaa-Pro aminopeptidase